ncbi:hypothetical protein [Desulfosporosinus sp. I2]|uniref:hypothetical protein n=1 Tax=Desulfosporosinus sp. I2 TaxID=1617025 RepID=UPI0005EE766A|nr:hypothetical protein [Desulfosporosinus sp. I2]
MRKNYCVIEKELPNQKNKIIANEYLKLLLLRGMTEHLVCKHRRIIETFLFERTKDTEYIEPDDLRNWLNTRYGSLKPTTFNVTFRVLNGFFTYFREEGHVSQITDIAFWRQTTRKSVPKFAKEYDYVKLKPHTLDLYFGHCSPSTVCKIRKISGLNIKDLNRISHPINLPIHVTESTEAYLKAPEE